MTTTDTLQQLNQFIEEKMSDWNVPGTAIAVVKDDQVILKRGYGFRSTAERLEVTPDTLFACASTTKAVTTLSMALAVEDGLLDWDTPVRNYLPFFKMKDPLATERLTPRDMACQRSGLPRHDAMWYNASVSREDIVERLAHLEPAEDLRSKWQYQNIMYMTAGYMVGKVTGTTWEDFVTSRILQPLGMTNTNFSLETSWQSDDFAHPYEEKDDDVHEMAFRDISTVGPAGAMNSSVSDMAQWVRLQLNQGKFNGQQLVSKENMAEMHKPHIPCNLHPWSFKETPVMNYGLGWFIEPYRGRHVLHHGGNIDGFSSLVSLMPDENIGIVVLTNLNANALPTVISRYIYDCLLNDDPIDWNQRLKEKTEQMKQDAEKEKEKIWEDQQPDTEPTHPLKEFAGEYEHPGYGKLYITCEEGSLSATYNGITMPMTHFHYNMFVFSHEPFNRDMLGSFSLNKKGRIDRVSLPLEPTPGAEEIVFTKNK